METFGLMHLTKTLSTESGQSWTSLDEDVAATGLAHSTSSSGPSITPNNLHPASSKPLRFLPKNWGLLRMQLNGLQLIYDHIEKNLKTTSNHNEVTRILSYFFLR